MAAHPITAQMRAKTTIIPVQDPELNHIDHL